MVEPRGTTQETFALSEETPGLYQVEVRQGISADVVSGVLNSQFLVTRKLAVASWEISRLEVTPQPARPQEPLAVSFLVSNLGQQEGDLTVTLEVDGVVEVEETLSVGPQTTRQVTHSLRGQPEGEYLLAVNGIQVQFTVIGPAEEPQPVVTVTPPAVVEEQGGSTVVLVSVVAALAVLTTAVYAFFRWRRWATRANGFPG